MNLGNGSPMQDMFVNLLTIPTVDELCAKLEREEHVFVRRAMVPDKYRVLAFAEEISGISAKGECDVCFCNKPVTCFIATRYDEILGYACYETTNKDYFGPTLVLKRERGKSIGKALLVRALEGLKELGYVYGIIGEVGPVQFYEKCVGATVIPNSTPGAYKDLLSLNKKPDYT